MGLVLGVVCSPATAAAEKNALGEAWVAKACRLGTPDYTDASTRLAALEAQIEALGLAADHGPADAALAALFRHRCFSFFPQQFDKVDAKGSALGLKTFWRDGALAWFQDTLRLGDAVGPARRYWVLPAYRRALTLETAPDSPLRSLLCSAADAHCGRETFGWRRRAERAFREFAELKRARSTDPRPRVNPLDCGEHVKGTAADTFSGWTECVMTNTPKVEALPLGALQAPTTGWLTVSGRRGHYGFCDEVRAYNLETGAAYISSSCSRLHLAQTGAVRHAATNAARKGALAMGRVPLANLREATWMMLLIEKVGLPITLESYGVVIPSRLEVELSNRGSGVGLGYSGSSSQTVLDWRYTVGKVALSSGDLTWPSDYNYAARQHAVALLQVAEAGFVEGCPPTAAPRHLMRPLHRPGVSGRDARPKDLSAANRTRWKALIGAKPPASCDPR
jgi:hypothetical protein